MTGRGDSPLFSFLGEIMNRLICILAMFIMPAIASAQVTTSDLMGLGMPAALAEKVSSIGSNATISLADGTSETDLSVYFADDTDTGIYSLTDDSIQIVAGGETGLYIIESGNNAQALFDNGTTSSPTISFLTDLNTGWFRNGEDTLTASAGGVQGFNIYETGSSAHAQFPVGSESTPGLSVMGDADTGIYNSGSGVFAISSNASRVGQFDSGGLNVYGEIYNSGTVASGGVLCVKSDSEFGQCTDQPDSSGDCTCS